MINNKILIVDDEPDICDLISEILSESGYSVNSAFSKKGTKVNIKFPINNK